MRPSYPIEGFQREIIHVECGEMESPLRSTYHDDDEGSKMKWILVPKTGVDAIGDGSALGRYEIAVPAINQQEKLDVDEATERRPESIVHKVIVQGLNMKTTHANSRTNGENYDADD